MFVLFVSSKYFFFCSHHILGLGVLISVSHSKEIGTSYFDFSFTNDTNDLEKWKQVMQRFQFKINEM